MRPDARRLAQLLSQTRGVDEWVIREETTRQATRSLGLDRVRRSADGETRALRALLLSDGEQGRSAATLEVTDDREIDAELARAVAEAAAGRGPSWALPPLAAPARVTLADPPVAADLGGTAEAALAEALGDGGRAASSARAIARVSTVAVMTSQGFSAEYRATAIDVEALVAAGDAAPTPLERLRVSARRRSDLSIAAEMTAAAARAAQRAAAAPCQPGRYDLVLSSAALATGRWGWFAPLVAQADAGALRLGVSRYRPGQSIFTGVGEAAAGDAAAGDAISLTSDGTLPFAPRSAPFGDLGEPVRRFTLIEHGIASGVALDLREAALARANPNGGVRNLVLAPGASTASALLAPGARPLLAVDELSWLDTDDRGGALSAQVSLGRLFAAGAQRPVAGGVIIGNLFEMFARARLSSDQVSHDWYRGPSAIRIDDVVVR